MEALDRLFELGSRALADSELLTLLLGQEFDCSLRDLANVSLAELTTIPGIGPVRAGRVVAAVEIGRRLSRGRDTRPRFGGPSAVADYLMAEMRFFEEERFRVVYLDIKSRLLGIEEISIGDIDSAPAGAREIFRGAVRRGAAGVIVAHNHPSGDPRPSRADILVTERLQQAGDLLGILLADHLVIGDGRYVSMRAEGLIPQEGEEGLRRVASGIA